LEGFDVLENAPLGRDQAAEIVRQYVSREADFWSEIERSNLMELASRPLMITQLAVLFENTGALPQRPAAICKRMIELLLQRWDAERGVTRQSRYSNFTVEDKHDLLAQISHYLTCEIQRTRFSDEDLLRAYNDASDRFGLPAAEAREVVGEIETHSGLIVQSGHDHFEFSHLVLQECLCAES
jgi:predicted NACHT family NTPase